MLDQANTSGLSTTSNTSAVNPVNALTTQAAAGGLKALAVDTNYHLRQIYINVVQVRFTELFPNICLYIYI